MSIASSAYGFGKVNVSLNIFYVIVLIPLAVLVSIAGSTIPGRWAARLSVVEALRTQ
jgi:ABC-type lipoprotein release transport system permease subunit